MLLDMAVGMVMRVIVFMMVVVMMIPAQVNMFFPATGFSQDDLLTLSATSASITHDLLFYWFPLQS